VMPRDYKRALATTKASEVSDTSDTDLQVAHG
jgi:hypothetical protein